MKIKLGLSILLVLAVFESQVALSQENYLPGYVVTAKEDTIHGLINFRDWKVNPNKIDFKTSNGEKTRYSPLEIKAFSVNNQIYLGAIVEVETSATRIDKIEYNSSFNIKIDTVFLKSIILGEKSLLLYKKIDGNTNFYIGQKEHFELLLYKKYAIKNNINKTIAENNKYIGQLTIYFAGCPSVKSKLNNLEYSKTSIEKLFKLYYDCFPSTIVHTNEKEKIKVNFGILMGISRSNLYFNSYHYDFLQKTEYQPSYNISGGLFNELVLPRNRGKLSLDNELIISSFSVSGEYVYFYYQDLNTTEYTNFKYSYLKINNLLRYRLPINKFKIYLTGGISDGFAFLETNYKKETVKIYLQKIVNETTAFTSTKYEFGSIFGLGTQIKMFSLDIRYEKGNGISKDILVDSSTKRFYLLLGYRF